MPRDIPPVTNINITGAILQNLIGEHAKTILEIGAHHGDHTAALLRTFPNAHLYAFEPDPRAIAAHRRLVKDARLTLYEMAIGGTNGRAEFHVSDGLPPGQADALKANYPKGWDQSGSL